ncbi:MAG: GDSL-type esterase/lipase family protein [Asticcacaulis sp.]
MTASLPPLSATLLDASGAVLKTTKRSKKRIVCIADSFGDTYGYTLVTSDSQPGVKDGTYSNITTNTRRCSSFMSWFQFLSGQQFDFNWPQMWATQGQTTTAALATAAAALDATQADYAIWQPGTNDWQLTSADVTIANDKAFIALCQARGIHCILMTISPRGGWTDAPNGTEQLRRWRQINKTNRWRQEAARQLKGVSCADTCATWGDPASANGAQLSGRDRGDSLHPSDGIGAFYLSLALWRCFQGLGFSYQPDLRNTGHTADYNATDNIYGNKLGNPCMQGTVTASGTGMSGTNPTNFVYARNSGSSATAVGSQAARTEGSDFGNTQKYVFAVPSTGTTNEQFRGEYIIASSQFSVGELVFAQIGVEIQSGVGMRCPWLHLFCMASDGTTILGKAEFAADGTGTFPNGSWKGVMRTDPIKIPSGTNTLKLRVVQTLDGSSTANGGTVYYTDAFVGRAPTAAELV